ncbi:neuromedin-U receptor 2-like [Oculina patagonica]
MTAEIVITKVIHSVLVATTLVGNLLVCLAVLRNKILQTPVNYLLMNLAIADLMIVISFTPRHILEGLYHHPRGLVGEILCKTITSDTFTWVGGVASAISLVVMAYERYTAITSPFGRRSTFNCRKLKIVVVLCWVVAELFNIPLFYVRRLNRERGFCESHWPSVSLALGNNFAWLILIGIIPFCFMVFCYGKVIKHLRREVVPGQQLSVSVMKSRKKVTKMLMTVTAIYGVCWIPNLILYVVWYYVLETDVMYTINKVFLVLFLVNSCANPIVYALQSRLFRRHMASYVICLCKKRSKNRVDFFVIFTTGRENSDLSNVILTRFVHRGSKVRGLSFSNLGVL